jgi:hypothetical protein
MRIKAILAGVAAAAALATAGAANASLVFVGSWKVDDGPDWQTGPLAYTGQEAAALLFGGQASDYQISTIDNKVADIDHKAWYSILDFPGPIDGGSRLAQNYSVKGPGGTYTDDGALLLQNQAASAYVMDNAGGAEFTNFAFRETAAAIPEPAAWALILTGFFGMGASLRASRRLRRRAVAVRA